MARFKIEWPDGSVEEVEQSDCITVSDFLNCSGMAEDGPAKVSVVIEDGQAAPAPAPKVAKPTATKFGAPK